MAEENSDPKRDLNREIEALYDKLKRLKNNETESRLLIEKLRILTKKNFINRMNVFKTFKKYKGLIYTVGFSSAPLILSIIANNPQAVFFIYTKESEEILDLIMEETGLKLTQCKREIMKKNSFENTMDLISLGLVYLNKEKNIDISEIGLDITGGTKIMSLACGMAAFALGPDGPDILYVDHEKYDKELRRPVPGTEIIKVIQNPLRTAGKMLKDKGLDTSHLVI